MQNTNHPQSPASLPAIEELRRLRDMLSEVAQSLNNQRAILLRRQRDLPPGILESIAALQQDLDGLEHSILDERTELGQLRSLAQTSALINTSLNLDEVLTRAMSEVINLTGAERGFIMLRTDHEEELDYRLARDITGSPVPDPRGQVSQTILRDVIETGTPLRADNAYKDPRMQDNMSIAQLSLRSVVCVPLIYRDRVIGAVYVDNRLRAGIFGEREVTLLTAFANQAAVAIENARLYASIQTTLAQITELRDLMDNVFSSVGSGIMTTDAADQVVMTNRAAQLILDQGAETLIGSPVRRVLPVPSDELDDVFEKVKTAGENHALDAELEVAARGRLSLNIKFSPLLDAEKTIQGVAMVVDDLTEQRQREEELDIMSRYLPPALVRNIDVISNLALGGERREVTCIFVDVRPLSTFAPGTRPPQIMDELNIFLAVATDVAHETQGVIDKYMGNEIMVLFNSQLNPMDDHALRAVQTALLIRSHFAAMYAQLGIPSHYYRIGMHTGVATLGNVGSRNRRDFTAIGDTINLSKRLEENARQGQIIISEETRRHLERSLLDKTITRDFAGVRFEERDPIKVKGREQYTRIYEVFES